MSLWNLSNIAILAARLLLTFLVPLVSFGHTAVNGCNNTSILTEQNTSKPLHVCILVEPSPITYVSGYANRFQALLHYFSETGDFAEVVTTEVVVSNPPCSWLGFPIHYTKGFRLPHYPLMSASCDWTGKAFRVAAKSRPHILHVTSPGFFAMAAVVYARVLQIPLLMSYHTHLPIYLRSYLPKCVQKPAEWLLWQLIRFFHGAADLTVLTSPQVQAEFVEHHVPRCHVWRKGIDVDRFHPRHYDNAMRNRMTSGHPEDYLILYIGRLATEKRLTDLQQILSRMPAGTRLCFVGSGPQELELREIFTVNAVFLGPMHGEELSQAFATADVFCMPSDSETLGFVVLESMASGVPVVAANAGGLRDIIDNGRTGFLVEPGNAKDFAEKLQLLRSNPQMAKEIAERAREETENWSWMASMDELKNVHYQTAAQHFRNRWEQRFWRSLKQNHLKGVFTTMFVGSMK